ncbi:MAG: hypothetical protein LC715_02000 [Gammaproteobacteria bacterium]|nr:hypothetical protein [Gammaproteobacteria bacterium]
MSRGLYLASTPMIALVAAAAARAHGGRTRLVLIEDFDLAARFEALLRQWRDNPFEDIVRLPGRYSEHLRGAPDRARGVRAFARRVRIKRGLRRETLAAIAALDAEFQPEQLWLGNDRKVETQFALHLAARRTGNPAPGRYLDDGLYTYLGDVRQRPWVRRVDWLVKRLTYGGWWQRADHAGTTPWIGEAWLVFPQWAPPCYRAATVHALPRAWFANRGFLRLCALAGREFEVPRRLSRRCSGVLVLPHSNQLRADPQHVERLRARLRAAAATRAPLALKHHPREVEPDPVGLLASGDAIALPALLPMELLLPLLPPGALLAGEGSTALLAARWLRPDLRVRDLGLSRGAYALRARALFAQLGIPVLEADSG